MKPRKGMKVGLKTVQRVFKRGPYTYCVMRCQCGSFALNVPWGQVIRGTAVSCRNCWNKERTAAVRDAVREVYRKLSAKRQKMAEKIRKRFGIKEEK